MADAIGALRNDRYSVAPLLTSPFGCTSATPRNVRGVSLCHEGTLSLWLTRSALCATIAIPSLRSLQVPSAAPVIINPSEMKQM